MNSYCFAQGIFHMHWYPADSVRPDELGSMIKCHSGRGFTRRGRGSDGLGKSYPVTLGAFVVLWTIPKHHKIATARPPPSCCARPRATTTGWGEGGDMAVALLRVFFCWGGRDRKHARTSVLVWVSGREGQPGISIILGTREHLGPTYAWDAG
jgi:hypothetical protein